MDNNTADRGGAYETPELECDLVMKGGVTSGMVYPYAILELARKYRFRSIGGTSAGGIAAAFVAAAEYARTVRHDPAGFERLRTHTEKLPGILTSLFQPSGTFRDLFNLALGVTGVGNWQQWVLSLLKHYSRHAVPLGAGAAIATLILLLATVGLGRPQEPLTPVILILPLAIGAFLIGGVIGIAIEIKKTLGRLQTHDFGICPGKTQDGYDTPGLINWLHDAIQDIAFGEDGSDTPLTFGHLQHAPDDHGITLNMVTTNMSMRRPHTLPELGIPGVEYPVDRWAELFPDDVNAYLADKAGSAATGWARFPLPQDLPVIVAVRMTLSFPILFRAVPARAPDHAEAGILWEFAKRREADGDNAYNYDAPLRDVWFSDGGLSSNFPIHMYDSLLPTRPTFALSLDDMPESIPAEIGIPENRTLLAESARIGHHLKIKAIPGTLSFLKTMLDAAKDWQDSLTSAMPGYRERIVRIYLTGDEGGLNLNMSPETSRKLMDYGRDAGACLAQDFNFDEHRWRRTLTSYDQLDETLSQLQITWEDNGFGDWYQSYYNRAESYGSVRQADRQKILDALSQTASGRHAMPALKDKSVLPKPKGALATRARF